MTTDPGNRGTCEKLLGIVDALDDLDHAGVTELAEHRSLPKSTTHYHLNILQENGFVVKDGEQYRLGLRFLEIGEQARRRVPLYEVAKPEVERLAAETAELALLMVEEQGLGVYLDKAKGPNAIDIDAPIGRHAHLHNRAMGKAILSRLSRERVQSIVDRHGLPSTAPNTITSERALFDELEAIRDRGVSYNDQESVEGLQGISVPILDGDEVLGAISVAGPTARISDDGSKAEIIDLLNKSKNVIELTLQNR